MIVASFTWQRYKQPLPPRGAWWRKEDKIMVAKDKAAQHPYAGKSVLDLLWEELDTVYDQLMQEGAPSKESLAEELHLTSAFSVARTLATEWYGVLRDWGELRGQAQGLAYAIALVQNPYACDVPAVKAEARRRYEAANPE